MNRLPTILLNRSLVVAVVLVGNASMWGASFPQYGDLPGVTMGSEFSISPDYSFINLFGSGLFGSGLFGSGSPVSPTDPASVDALANSAIVGSPGGLPSPVDPSAYSQLQLLRSGSNFPDALQTTSNLADTFDAGGQAIPEPATAVLCVTGLLGGIAAGRRAAVFSWQLHHERARAVGNSSQFLLGDTS